MPSHFTGMFRSYMRNIYVFKSMLVAARESCQGGFYSIGSKPLKGALNLVPAGYHENSPLRKAIDSERGLNRVRRSRIRSGNGCKVIAFFFFFIWTLFFSPHTVVALSEPYPFLAPYLSKPLPIPSSLQPDSPTVMQQAKETPEWKREWDAARHAVRSSLFEAAVRTYEHLLEMKDLEEARWELASVLIIMGRHQEALAFVEVLHEASPDRPDYAKALAYLFLKMGRYKSAGELFFKIAAREPENTMGLAGAIQSFLEEGRKKEALPLLERLWNNDKDNQGLRKKLAFLAYELHEDTIGKYHLRQLAEDKDADQETIYRVAKTYARLNLPREAEPYWKRLLIYRPDSLEAHQSLAFFYQEEGRVEEALPHLLYLNVSQPDNHDLLKRIGQCYVGQQEFALALDFFERSIRLAPDDKEAVRFVVNIHAALGDKAETLKALEHYFRIEAHPGEESLKKAAALYDEAGFAGQAIEVYRRLLEVSPDDSDILVSLARNFLEVGNAEEALTVWKKLAKIAPDVVPVYRSMAELLEKLGRRHELLDVLEIIHERDPSDQETAIKLAEKYLENGNLEESIHVLESLADATNLSPSYYSLRARLHVRQGEYALAVPIFEEYLAIEPQDDDARLKCLVAAGHTGDLATLRKHYGELVADRDSLSRDHRFQIAEALYYSGALGEAQAIFQQIVEVSMGHFQENNSGPFNEALTVKSAVRLSDIYRELGLLYEAEEALRIGFVLTGEPLLMKGLFHIALERGDHSKARQWLTELKKAFPPRETHLRVMEARLLLARGERRQAVKLARSLVRDLFKNFGQGDERHDDGQHGGKVALASFLVEIGEDTSAERLCLSILKQAPTLLEPKALLAKIFRKRGESLSSLSAIQGLNSSKQLEFAGLLKKYGLYDSMGQAAAKVIDQVPQSLRARIFVAQSLGLQGRKDQARAAWRGLAEDYPNNSFILTELARQLFISGDLDDAARLCGRLLNNGLRPDIILMQARILWRQNSWEEAMSRYQVVQEPTVASLLEKEAKTLQFTLPTPTLQRSIWEVVTGTPGKSFSHALAEKVMAVPTYLEFMSTERRRYNLEAAKLYALSRWQEQFEAEFLVRKAIKRGEYFLAQKEYEALLLSYPSEKILLYDLAGVYSRQGNLGKEAAAYEKLLADNIDFVELRNAMERNRLKQKPRLVASAGYRKEEGKKDYKDIEKDWQQLSVWYSPKTRHEIEVDVSRINYESVTRQDVLRSTRAFATYKADIISGFDVSIGAGLESFDSGNANVGLFMFEATGKIGDKLVGTIGFDRDVIADTAASLSRELVQQNIRMGISFEPLSRLAIGGGYEARDYSDNNWTTGYDLWSSYVLLSEPTFLKVFYIYDFKESKEGEVSGQLQQDGFAADDHPYWAPKNYWANEFGLEFKHYLSKETLDRGTPKYYTAQYSVGHDSDGSGFQSIEGNFFVEINTHLLVKASFELSSSPTYRKKHYLLSASYRW